MRKVTLMIVAAGMLAGCGPDLNGVLNRLRTQNIAQSKQIADLQQQVSDRDQHLAQLQSEVDGKTPRVQTLPDDRLNALFTASSVEIRKQTDAWDFGTGKQTGFRVFVRVLAADGTVIPATGEMSIEAFSLPPSPAEPVRIGTWEFSAEAMKKCWYDTLGLKQFAFDCPWDKAPAGGPVSFRITFTDALTGRVLTATFNKTIKVQN